MEALEGALHVVSMEPRGEAVRSELDSLEAKALIEGRGLLRGAELHDL